MNLNINKLYLAKTVADTLKNKIDFQLDEKRRDINLTEDGYKQAKELLGKIKSGEAKAGDLNVARQFLKDNGVECLPVEKNPMQELMENLPDLDAVPLADL